MPKVAKELSAVEVKRITQPGFHAVGGVSGLTLRVKETGSRQWVLRATLDGKRHNIGLGGFPDVTLAQARERAREYKEQTQQNGERKMTNEQMTKREIIAAQIMAATADLYATSYHEVAIHACAQADALLWALDQKNLDESLKATIRHPEGAL